jgi:hypothetical protein
MAGAAQGVQQFRLRLAELPAAERPRLHQEFHRQANRQFGEALAKLLNADQQQRLRQIALRQEGLFALGDPEVAAELALSDAQRRQFQSIIQETQRRFVALGRKAETSGNPAAVEREARQIRSEQQDKIEALLTEAQRKKWRRLLGER